MRSVPTSSVAHQRLDAAVAVAGGKWVAITTLPTATPITFGVGRDQAHLLSATGRGRITTPLHLGLLGWSQLRTGVEAEARDRSEPSNHADEAAGAIEECVLEIGFLELTRREVGGSQVGLRQLRPPEAA